MYKLVAKNGHGLGVAGATRFGAAPQTLENRTVESTNKGLASFIGDELNSSIKIGSQSDFHLCRLNGRQLCELWCVGGR